jgi:hypothetical protein
MLRFFPFLLSFYFSVLLVIKNAFIRVFIFIKMTKTTFLIPNSEITKLGAQAGRSSMLRYIKEFVLVTYFGCKFQFRINF